MQEAFPCLHAICNAVHPSSSTALRKFIRGVQILPLASLRTTACAFACAFSHSSECRSASSINNLAHSACPSLQQRCRAVAPSEEDAIGDSKTVRGMVKSIFHVYSRSKWVHVSTGARHTVKQGSYLIETVRSGLEEATIDREEAPQCDGCQEHRQSLAVTLRCLSGHMDRRHT